MTKIAQRDNIPVAEQWDLSTIFADTEAWEHSFQEAAALSQEMPAYSGRLGESGELLYEFLQKEELLSRKLDNLYVYAKMRLDEDNRVSLYQSLKDRAQSLSVRAGEALSFSTPELLAVGEAHLKEMMDAYEPLRLYARAFENILRYAPHTLSASEEQLLAMTGEMAQSSHTTFSLFNDADLRFPTIEDEKGEPLAITHANYIKLLESSDRRVRREAFEGLYSAYESYRNTIAAMLTGNAKGESFYARVRNYDSVLEQALFSDDVTIELYDSLIAAVRQNLTGFYEYLDLRKQVLGVEELHYYDIYTPLVGDMNKVVPFEEGFRMVKEAMAVLGPEYVELLERARAERWMDVRENEGKTSGAYSWGTYDTHPFVLMSYQDNLQSVFTMAHELGHSLHSYFSWRERPYPYAYYTIFVAEVASTVNEALLTHYLLERATDKQERIYLLNQYLEEFRGTVYRQTMFAEFEKRYHARIENMEGLTADDLCALYGELNRDYFGDAIVADPQIAVEWARIPHFYNSFYVYKYATGFTAAAALSQRIIKGEPGAVEAYLQFLAGGCSDYPLELLKKAGVDLRDPQTLDDVFATFRARLHELKTLLQD